MRRHSVFPPLRDLPWLVACYALTALLCWMVAFPRDFLHVIGVTP